MTQAQLQAFVRDYCDGAIWTDKNVAQKSLLPMVFMPLALGVFADWTKRELEQIGCIYGNTRRDKTVPGRAINGYPMFAACALVHRDDWARLMPAIEAEQ